MSRGPIATTLSHDPDSYPLPSLRSIDRRGAVRCTGPVCVAASPFRFGDLEEHPQHLEQQTSAEHEGKQNCTHPR